MPPQVPMTGTSEPRSWRGNSKRPRPTRSRRGPLWPIVSHGVHPHPKGLGVRAVGVRAVSPPPHHEACPQSRNACPHPTPPLQLYAESWCTARCTSWVYKCTMCSLGLQGHTGRGRIGAERAFAAGMKGKGSKFAFQMHMRMRIFQGGSIGPPFKWYNAILHKECRAIAI